MARVVANRNLGTVKPTFEEVRDWHAEKMHPTRMNFDDQAVYENVYHAGRWAGVFQCLDLSTNITACDGSVKALSEVVEGDVIKSYDEQLKAFVDVSVTKVIDQGVRECIKLEFDDGNHIICTDDHLFLTQRGWVKAAELEHEDDLVSFSNPTSS